MSEDPRQQQSWQRWIVQVVGVMSVSMLLYLSLTIWSGAEQLGVALREFSAASRLPVIVGLVLAGWLLRGLRWHYYTRCLSLHVPFGSNLLVFLASFAFTATPGKAGEVVKSVLLRVQYQIRVPDTAGILLVERMLDLLAVLMLAAGGLTMLVDAWLYFAVCVVLVGGVTVFVLSEPLYRGVFDLLGRLPRLGRLATAFIELFDSGRRLLSPRPFAIGLGVGVVAWACEAIATHLILVDLGAGHSLLTSLSIYGIATLVGALSMLPGGVGGFEAAMLLMLNGLGMDRSGAVAGTLITRFSTLWLVSFVGMVFMGVWWAIAGRQNLTAREHAEWH